MASYNWVQEPLSQAPFCQKLGNLVYNSEHKSFLGKTAKRWGRDLSFFLTIWVALVYGLPQLQHHYGVVATSPTLSFQPLPRDDRSTLIWFKALNYEGYKYWENQLIDFLSEYKMKGQTASSSQNLYNCDFNNPPPPGKVCYVDIREFAPCIEENHFSYHKSSPCIFLKLNNLLGWRPEFYNNTNNLPDDMPMDLKQHIRVVQGRPYANMVWISCEGETPADKEFLGPISYIPSRGLPGYYFPYENTEGYLSPLVALYLERPRIGIVINIECRVWARNIEYQKEEHIGMVNFEVMID